MYKPKETVNVICVAWLGKEGKNGKVWEVKQLQQSLVSNLFDFTGFYSCQNHVENLFS